MQGPAGSQADPPCFSTFNRFTDCGNGTVTDGVTRLIWLKDWDCLGVKNWKAANDAAAALADGSADGVTCGLSDGSSAGEWRLPTIEEWRMKTLADVWEDLSMVKLTCLLPAIPDTAGPGCWSQGNPFTNVASSGYWSATSGAGDPSGAWDVFLNDGGVGSSGETDFGQVVAVRGGP